MSRETFALIVQTATPLLLALLGLFVAWAQKKVHSATKNQQLQGAVDLLLSGATGVVADLEQHVVADLKDPTKPGTWDQISKEAVRNTAVTRLRSLYPSAVAALKEHGSDEQVTSLLGTLVEAAVLKYKKP